MTATSPKKSDLGIRTLSAIAMVAVAGTALWLGGWVWTGFVVLVALGVLWEWWGLVRGFGTGALSRLVWLTVGLAYIGFSSAALIAFRGWALQPALLPIIYVIAIDVFAYFFGRTIGGPKIAPTISPSKTWAGLGGAVVGAMVVGLANHAVEEGPQAVANMSGVLVFALVTLSVAVAVVAQAGDFFESWMKRRAGVKDSGNLIPGHGGLFDRIDGLLALVCLYALIYWPF